MTQEPWRYLRWWLSNHAAFTVVPAFFTVILGPAILVGSALESDFQTALGGAGLFLVGLHLILFPMFEYQRSSRPDTTTSANVEEPDA